MKKTLSKGLAALLALSLVACGNNAASTNNAEPAATEEATAAAEPAAQPADNGGVNGVAALKDYNVRRALQLGVDRSAIVTALDAGDVYYELYGFVPKGFGGVNGDFRQEVDDDQPYVYTDKDEARALLAEAGFGPDNPLKLEYVYNSTAVHDLVAEVLKAQWAEIGVELTVRSAEWQTFLEERDQQGKFELARGAMSADYMDVSTFMDMAKTSNQQGAVTWGDDKYDDMMNQSLLMEGNDRLEFLHGAEKYLVEETAQVIPLFAYNTIYLRKPGVNGEISSPQANHLFWYVENPGETTFTYAIGEPGLLDPATGTDSTTSYVSNQLNYPLFYISEDGSMKNAACTDYTVSDDNLTYTFTIESNTWSDGVPCTAADYEYGIKRALGMGEADSYYSYFISDFVAGAKDKRGADVADMADVGVKALDDNTLEITLAQPCPYFVNLLNMGVFYALRPDFAPEHDETWSGTGATFPTNAPFVPVKIDLNDEVVMEKNPNFVHADQVKVDTLVAKDIDDQDAQFLAFQTGEIDFATSLSPDVLKTYTDDSPELIINPSVINYYVLINEYAE